jgi:hypothetical protein
MPTRNNAAGQTRRLERKITLISGEIQTIESALYAAPKGDLEGQHFLLQQKRNHAVRGVVLELQLSTEDLLNAWLKSFFLRCKPWKVRQAERRSPKLARALDQLLAGSGSLNFERKLDLTEGTGLISKGTRKKLSKLYSIRNKCSHYWLIDLPVRRNIQRNQPKRRLLEYENRNLFDTAVLKDFVKEYGRIYYNLWLKVYA